MRLLLSPVLLPVAALFFLLAWFRGKLYDWGVLPSEKVDAKVVCVGNITSGGTGKTPLVRWLANEFSKRGKKVCVLSRGYGRSTQEILKVNPQSTTVSDFGDEALQLSKQLKNIPVYVGIDRLAAARIITEVEKPDLILLDDGFQHRRLKRDMDLVVLDTTQPAWNYWPLPLGFGREGKSALKRASALMLSKTNLASGSELAKWEAWQLPLLKFDWEIRRARGLDGEMISLETRKGVRTALLSALGRPEVFEKQVMELGVQVVYHQSFRDHHQFTAKEVSDFLKVVKDHNIDLILVTEKDAVKLTKFDLPRSKFFVVELEVSLTKGKEDFDSLFHRLLA